MSDIQIFLMAIVGLLVFRTLAMIAIQSGAPGVLFSLATVVSFVVATVYAVRIIVIYL